MCGIRKNSNFSPGPRPVYNFGDRCGLELGCDADARKNKNRRAAWWAVSTAAVEASMRRLICLVGRDNCPDVVNTSSESVKTSNKQTMQTTRHASKIKHQ